MIGKKVTWLVLLMLIVGIGAFVVAMTSPAQAGPPVNCKFVSCAAPDCLEGEHLAIPPGACCPVCVPD